MSTFGSFTKSVHGTETFPEGISDSIYSIYFALVIFLVTRRERD